MRRYIEAKTFEEFCCNQNKLIEVLNHRTDTLQGHIINIENNLGKMKVDTAWTKKILLAIFSITAIALISSLIKSGWGLI